MAYEFPSTTKSEFVFVNFSVWFAPILFVLLVRRFWFLVGICAVPILVIFIARVYYAWQIHRFGLISGGAKGDWAGWLTTLFGGLSLFVVAIALVWMAFNALVNRAGIKS
jgi:hypothetical protein